MMIDAAPPVKHVCKMSDEERLQMLNKQFKHFYRLLVDYQYVPQASYEKIGSLERYFSGLPVVNFNAVFGCQKNPEEYDACITEELQFFGSTPFFWYVDEDAPFKFKEALKKHGFVDAGIFRGVMRPLDVPIASTSIADDCVLEMVEDEKTMEEFNNLVCRVFDLGSPNKEAYKEILWNLTQEKDRQWYHWVARKQGRVVSAVSTMIQDGIVSFWNGASEPELRKQGLITALGRYSLQHAMANGASIGSSYLMSEGLAFGICSKVGFSTKWRFHSFVSPKTS